ncbi:hypothetical protein E1218_04705 [Kribbella turkmenica]|uniref:Uncharacterized protein n=1 Tax=Kribbella turkmenica TaxID=2530375 RepID=A0A4R4XF59_9ACTN|nr:hypothetical protein [Kribbella turkmenica]TDD29330.1 hypothetical protein E1218_04705 [Kribbella turkmenica]
MHEVDGKNYHLKTVTTASISHGATDQHPTPADRRFFVRLGGAKVRPGAKIRLAELGRIPDQCLTRFHRNTDMGNIEPSDQAARPRLAGTAILRVQVRQPTSGTVFLALYEADE